MGCLLELVERSKSMVRAFAGVGGQQGARVRALSVLHAGATRLQAISFEVVLHSTFTVRRPLQTCKTHPLNGRPATKPAPVVKRWWTVRSSGARISMNGRRAGFARTQRRSAVVPRGRQWICRARGSVRRTRTRSPEIKVEPGSSFSRVGAAAPLALPAQMRHRVVFARGRQIGHHVRSAFN